MTWRHRACGYFRAAIVLVCGLMLGVGDALAQEAKTAAPVVPAAAAKGAAVNDAKGKAALADQKDEEDAQTNAVVETSSALLAGLRIKNVSVEPRDEKTATVKFDIVWTNSWRYGNFFDAAWVFFKVRGDGTTGWQHAKLSADKVLNPTGFGQDKGGTPLDFVVSEDAVGMIVRRAEPGDGLTDAKKVTAVLDVKSLKGVADIAKASVKVIGIEMVFIPEGPFLVGRGNGMPARYMGPGSGGLEQNWLYKHNGKETLTPMPYLNGGDVDGWAVGRARTEKYDPPPFRIESENAIPTGKKKGALWAVNITPEDGGEIPAAFPKGYGAFYCMKRIGPTAGQYAEFLNTLTDAQAKPRFYEHGHGMDIKRTGTAPNDTYTALKPDDLQQWVSFADGVVFAAWAGIRPTTELEYEKFNRGVRPAIPNDAMPSCWGVAETGQAGNYERPVSIANAVGRGFKGTHGNGTVELPADWPPDIRGAIIRNDYFYGASHAPMHLLVGGRMYAASQNADRHGWTGTHGGPSANWTFAGWRGARTSPAGDTTVGPVTGELDLETKRLTKLPKTFQLDGSFDEWAGVKPVAVADSAVFVFPVHERYPSIFTPTWWHGPKDVSAKAWLATDGDALLVAGEVTDDKHVNDKTGTEIYIGDCMQVGLVNADGTQWNIGAALTAKGVELQQWDGPNDALIKSAKCAVKRDDAAGVTRYEFRLPFADFGVGAGADCTFYFNFFDNDGFMTVKRDGNRLLPTPQVRRLQWAPERTEPFTRRNYPKFVVGE
jgi:hypothetical protein